MASGQVESGFVGCEAQENLMVELKTGAEASEKLEPEALEDFGELILRWLVGG